MTFQKLSAFTKKVQDLSDKPSLTPTELKAQFDAAPEEVRQYLNKLIDALKLTTSGDSGAKNIGATTISGIVGSDVQTILESLKAYPYAKGETYSKTEVDNKLAVKGSSSTLTLNAGASQDVAITYPSGRFSSTPILNYDIFDTDIDGKYLLADGIVANTKDGATIRVKNKGTTIQYVIVYWTAQ